ncbi:MAG: PH domain-containing protein [Rothia sp. (in: high G+C Gram-positive bacteria)]|uniref:PH domain-containing protein n=1 Tax=Rothia sp. (in: high G+C Gram-positive bacteria) TaxID=1885016 RepID=UPI002700F052|nr:PH domain-containing protein [Rothia sp. (in: high G+C Gram-positive bacteria)]
MSEQVPTSESPAVSTDITAREEAALTWRRAHPLSPLVRAWLIIVVFIYTIANNLVDDLFTGEEPLDLRELGQSGPPDTVFLSWTSIFGGFWFLGVLAVFFLLLLLPFLSTWFFYRFAVDDRNVYIKSGMLFKTERKARLDRVQSIDVNRPLMARLLGLADLKFDVADGDSSALRVQFLKYSEARSLREQLLAQVRALKAGSATSPAASAPVEQSAHRDIADRLGDHLTENFLGVKDSGEQLIVKVPVARLLGSMVLSLGWVMGLLFLLGMGGLMFWAEMSLGAIFASNAAVILAIVSSTWKRFNTGFNFSLSTSPDGLKTRFGFTDTTTQTLPEGRVQRISVEQPLLWRITGWYRVQVTLLGKGEGQGEFAGELLPVGTLDDVMRVLPLVLPAQQDGGVSPAQLMAGLAGGNAEQGFTVSPASARWFDPLTYRRNGFAVTPLLLLVRSGRWVRRLSFVPHLKVQSLELSQGPLQKRAGLAHLSLRVAGGTLPTAVHNADAEVARALTVRLAQLGVAPAPVPTSADAGKGSGTSSPLPPYELLPLPGTEIGN